MKNLKLIFYTAFLITLFSSCGKDSNQFDNTINNEVIESNTVEVTELDSDENSEDCDLTGSFIVSNIRNLSTTFTNVEIYHEDNVFEIIGRSSTGDMDIEFIMVFDLADILDPDIRPTSFVSKICNSEEEIIACCITEDSSGRITNRCWGAGNNIELEFSSIDFNYTGDVLEGSFSGTFDHYTDKDVSGCFRFVK